MGVCIVEHCERTHWGRGYCQGHYARLLRTGDVQAAKPLQVKGRNGDRCRVEGCTHKPHARNLCGTHLSRLRQHGDVLADVPIGVAKYDGLCPVDGCDRPLCANGHCRLHDRRLRAYGQPDLPVITPANCAVARCDRAAKAGGYCNSHYERLRLYGDVRADQPFKVYRPDLPCDLDGCERPHYCLGFCSNHYQQRISKPRRKALEEAALGDVDARRLQARIDFYGGCCWMCRAPWTCIDPVKPLSRGGSNWPANLRPACTSCNASKHNRWPFDTSTRKAA
ncbi:HNH endonuclease [Nocardioides speluncae]|uniref:HNH endonuclease n=1 Tax=Nocardioides speluncae TaxID=2670337 RepID=UPI001F0B742A|nr:HNH endonuclease signature motif containing protein [Nocardioides speluncae]